MGTLDDEPLVIGLCSLGNVLGSCAMCGDSQVGAAKLLIASKSCSSNDAFEIYSHNSANVWNGLTGSKLSASKYQPTVDR